MCGIAGLFRRDAVLPSREDAARMASTMRHRGPDGEGAWAGGPVALGHVRLAIRDPSSAGNQPMVEPGGSGVLVYNGEVYNDVELRAELTRAGVVWRGHSDAEVVLHALARWGVERAARRFDGMFALAWWDARTRELWLVRDRFGTKPLHVHTSPDRLAFGSEARAIAALEGRPLEVDRSALQRRLLLRIADAAPPPFLGLEDVLPGEAWRIGAHGIERRVYADLVAEVDPGRIVAGAREPLERAQARLRTVLEEVVRAHVVSDAPVAAFTSGGVDSNLVAAIARQARPDLVAYTMDSGGPESELEAATRAARHLGLPLRPVRVDRETFLRAWPEAIEREEFPTLHESHVASLVLARAARADGIAVALTGEGSDEVFGGYDYFRRTRRQWVEATRPWSRLTHAGRARRRELEAAPFRYQSIRREPTTRMRLETAFTASEDARARALLARFRDVGPPPDRAVLAHGVDAMRRYLGTILLRHDRISMAASIEARVPFLSNRLADLGLHLPARYKLRGKVGKWLLKRVAAEWLPRELVYARKKGFPVNVAHHVGTTPLLRDGYLAQTLRWSRAAQADLIPRLEADPEFRFYVVSAELFGRLHAGGESPAALGERLLALGAG